MTQLGVRSALHHPALVDHDHLVGALGRREPVRDGDRGPRLHEPLERAADLHLQRRVDGAGGLVEDQQVGVGEVRAQERDELPLAGRQRLAALADLGVQPARAGRRSQSSMPSSTADSRISSSVASSLP